LFSIEFLIGLQQEYFIIINCFYNKLLSISLNFIVFSCIGIFIYLIK